MVIQMPTLTEKSQPASRLRLLTLLAIAHASLAFYLWLCAFELDLVLAPVRIWVALAWSWATWPVLMVVASRRSLARFAERALISPIVGGTDKVLTDCGLTSRSTRTARRRRLRAVRSASVSSSR